MNNLIKIENNKNYGLVVSSRIIAKELNKRHDHVIRDLEKILENPNLGNLIISSTYKVAGQIRVYKEYLLTKDGFTLYMFNIQGYNDFKMAYINRFNEMEKELLELKSEINTKDKYLLNIIKANGEANRAYALSKYEEEYVLPMENKIKEDAPKVEFYEDVASSESTIDIGQVAKTLNIKGLGRNKLFDFLREQKILRQNNEPYQKYIDEGWFKLAEKKWNKPNGEVCVSLKTAVYQKGLDKISKRIKQEYRI